MEQTVNLQSAELALYSLLLAAGQASRFGGPKQLAVFQDESLVRRSLVLGIQATGQQTVLIVGAQWQAVYEDCGSLAPFIVNNENYASGMASSIACGTRAVQPMADAVLILLADQPLITIDHLISLEKAWRAQPSNIVATAFKQIVGPPVIFPAAYFAALLALNGDAGARCVLEENSDAVVKIPFADAAVDIDTAEDLQRLGV
jgi:CTP:molybdopterin cytidylyltransferase MocA